MAIEEDFAESLAQYFGPWRGQGVKEEIARWVRERSVPIEWLFTIRQKLIKTRKIEPVNTVGIVELESAYWDLEVRHSQAEESKRLLEDMTVEKHEDREVVADFFEAIRKRMEENKRRESGVDE